jgi:hypothetical protein
MIPAVNPPGDDFAKEALTLLAFAIVIVFLRCSARIQATGLRKLKVDDWGMKVAVVCDESPALPPVF